MKAIIQKRMILPEVYSASGIEFFNDIIYVIGDDSPWLHLLSQNGELLERVPLSEDASLKPSRIPKKEKADLETLTVAVYQNIPYLLSLGSGSKKIKRDVGFLINLNTLDVKTLSLADLFASFRSMEEVVGVGKLNLEGLAASNHELTFLTRGNVSGKNVTISYDLNIFFEYMLKHKPLPPPRITSFQLPAINGIASGFSGASYVPNKDLLLFTASVENTDNEIDDGQVLGSYAGIIKLNANKDNDIQYCTILYNGDIYKGKVESICVLNYSSDSIEALAVTDSDGEDSELLWLDILF